jgi:thioredoxin 1
MLGKYPYFKQKQHNMSEKLKVMYFSAVWCGPCKMFKPAFEDVVKEFGDDIEVIYYDVDNDREAASAKLISAVPTVIMSKGTQDVFRNSGVMSKAALKEQIEKNK